MIGLDAKYDSVAGIARDMTAAELAAVIIVGGLKGEGFSVQTTRVDLLAKLPTMLRVMADSIEKQTKGGA